MRSFHHHIKHQQALISRSAQFIKPLVRPISTRITSQRPNRAAADVLENSEVQRDIEADSVVPTSTSEVSTSSLSSTDVDPSEPEISKAERRKARRVPPTIITPSCLPCTTDQLRSMFENGALLIDKPLQWTSFDVCGKLRNKLKFLSIKKVGHAGTLDPLATGLLVVATGAGTKFCDDFMALEKEYSGVIRLGEATETYDAEGDITETAPWQHVTDEDLKAAAAKFVGDIMQVPPMYSAIKVKGQKLYDLAREGTTIEREPRPVTIMSFKVWRAQALDASSSTASPSAQASQESSVSGEETITSNTPTHVRDAPSSSAASVPGSSTAVTGSEGYVKLDKHNLAERTAIRPGQDICFHVACSKGTYIRSLAYDLGKSLGTVAHLTALRRESIGELKVENAWQLKDLLSMLDEVKEGKHESS